MKTNSTGENPFSLSISDLMAGILFIFILLLMGAMLKVQQESDKRENIGEEYLRLREIKNRVISELQRDLQDRKQVDLDPTTGTIRINESLLFEKNKYDLKQEGKVFLHGFIPAFSKILLKNDVVKDSLLKDIVVAGHTDRTGTYNYNMGLSLRRAESVIDYIYSIEMPNFKYKSELQPFLVGAGSSYWDTLTNKPATDPENRRVEFQFNFKDIDQLDNNIGNQNE